MANIEEPPPTPEELELNTIMNTNDFNEMRSYNIMGNNSKRSFRETYSTDGRII